MKKPPSQGDRGLRNAAVAASIETYALPNPSRQAPYLTRRYGLTPATAGVVAELAFPSHDHRRA